jgi:hypothetical protein
MTIIQGGGGTVVLKELIQLQTSIGKSQNYVTGHRIILSRIGRGVRDL